MDELQELSKLLSAAWVLAIKIKPQYANTSEYYYCDKFTRHISKAQGAVGGMIFRQERKNEGKGNSPNE